MLNFFQSIAATLELLFSLLESVINSILQLLEICVTIVALTANLSPLLPTIIGTSFLIVIAVSVAKFIVGR